MPRVGNRSGADVADEVTVCRVGELADGASRVADVAGTAVAVFRVGPEYYAIAARCPHAGASLADGPVEDLVVTCPWHYWRFRLTDGAWADNPRIKTACYPVRVVDGEVRVGGPGGA